MVNLSCWHQFNVFSFSFSYRFQRSIKGCKHLLKELFIGVRRVMHLTEDEAAIALKEYTGPQVEIETRSTVGKLLMLLTKATYEYCHVM